MNERINNQSLELIQEKRDTQNDYQLQRAKSVLNKAYKIKNENNFRISSVI